MAPVLKILGVPRLPPGGSLGTGKRNLACRADFFSACKWGFRIAFGAKANVRSKVLLMFENGVEVLTRFGRYNEQ